MQFGACSSGAIRLVGKKIGGVFAEMMLLAFQEAENTSGASANPSAFRKDPEAGESEPEDGAKSGLNAETWDRNGSPDAAGGDESTESASSSDAAATSSSSDDNAGKWTVLLACWRALAFAMFTLHFAAFRYGPNPFARSMVNGPTKLCACTAVGDCDFHSPEVRLLKGQQGCKTTEVKLQRHGWVEWGFQPR